MIDEEWTRKLQESLPCSYWARNLYIFEITYPPMGGNGEGNILWLEDIP